MKLLTEEIRKRIPPLYSQEEVTDPIVHVKFFTPWTQWTWYATEFDGTDLFFGYVVGLEKELGYFSLSELESITGPAGLKIERDMYFDPIPLSKVYALEGERLLMPMVRRSQDTGEEKQPKPGYSDWEYCQVGKTRFRARKEPNGMVFQQMSPTFVPEEVEECVRKLESKLKAPSGKGPLFPHVAGKKAPLYPHVAKGCDTAARLPQTELTPSQGAVILPGWGYHVEYMGNITGEFRRANTEVPVKILELRYRGRSDDVLIQLEDGRKGITTVRGLKPSPGSLPQTTSARGTCFVDAWRFQMKEQEGDLIHGTVLSGDKRIAHAWVETETGYIWEPETKTFYTKAGFEKAASPVEDVRYSITEAAQLVARANNYGPWSVKERRKFLVPQTVSSGARHLLSWVSEPLPPEAY